MVDFLIFLINYRETGPMMNIPTTFLHVRICLKMVKCVIAKDETEKCGLPELECLPMFGLHACTGYFFKMYEKKERHG